MDKKIIHTNCIRELREKRGYSLFRIAESIGATLDEMRKIENGETSLSADQIVKLAAAFKINSYEIIGLPIDGEAAAAFDDAQIGYTIGWLLEAANKLDVPLSHEALAHWVIHVCKVALDGRMKFEQNRDLAFETIMEIKKAEGKTDTVVSMQGVKRLH